MILTTARAASILVIALLAGGCATADRLLFQTLAGESPAEPNSTIEPEAIIGLGAPPPGLHRSRFRPNPVTPGEPAASEIGRTMARLRLDFMDLSHKLAFYDDELQFRRRALTATIDAYRDGIDDLGLEAGDPVPRNDPAFASQADGLQSKLGRIYGELLGFNNLAAKLTADSAAASGMLEAVRALKARGDASPAEVAELEVLESEIDAAVLLTHQFLSELHLDISAQTEYAADQRRRVQGLLQKVARDEGKTAEPQANPARPARQSAALTGNTAAPVPGPAEAPDEAPAPMAAAPAVPAARPQPAPPRPAQAASRRPLITIRFGETDVDYERPLYDAVRAALERRPDVRFDLVGVSAPTEAGGTTPSVRRRTVEVRQVLEAMGMPPSRIALSTTTSGETAGDEIRIYVRAPGQASARPAAPQPEQAAAQTAPRASAPAEPAAAGPSPRPLVTVRFDRDDIDYQQPLYEALRVALNRRPAARFDLVSIGAGTDFVRGSGPAMRRAESVMRSLADMGMPAERVTLEAAVMADEAVDRVLLFVR